MRTTRLALCAVVIVLASLLALSCDNSYGIFANVQQETAQNGSKLFQETPVHGFFLFNSQYYAATSTLNVKSQGGWSKVSIGSSSYTLRSAVLAGTKIYALVEKGSSILLYSSTDGSSWSDVALPAQTYGGTDHDFTFETLFAANGKLYAASHGPYNAAVNLATTNPYSLWYLNGSTFSQATAGFVPNTNNTIRGVVWDGTNYWFASEDKIFSGPAGDPDPSHATDASASFTGLSGTFWCISFAGSKVYVTTKGGYLFQQGTAAGSGISSSYPLPLTQVVEIPAASATSLLVGTDANASSLIAAVGYYEGGSFNAMGSGDQDAGVTKSKAIYSTTVSASPVHAFFYDGDPANNAAAGTLFICVSPGAYTTSYYGLYASIWDPGSKTWSGWKSE